MPRAPRALPIALSGVLLVGGCSDLIGPVDPITELPRALTVLERQLIDGGNTFGLALFREVAEADQRPNVMLSPLSASMALGMTLNGADGETFDAMRSSLGFETLSQEEINASYRDLIQLLTDLDPTVHFDVANSVWANEDVPIRDTFIQAVRDAFGARAESRDFGDAATADAINAWVEENTNGFIDEIIETLDPNLALLLINAIYFEGVWTTEFDPDETRRGAFTRSDGSTIRVDMMSVSDSEWPTASGLDYAAIELPYGGGAFSMVIAMPHEDVRSFAATLDRARWDAIVGSLDPRELDAVSLPKFELSYDVFLNDALKDLGMSVAFGPDADFTRLSPIGDQLCIDFVRQKSFIEVDERGTRAAAATAVGVGPVSFNGFIADRPFVFAIRERLSGTILFVGLMEDPTAAAQSPEPVDGGCT